MFYQFFFFTCLKSLMNSIKKVQLCDAAIWSSHLNKCNGLMSDVWITSSSLVILCFSLISFFSMLYDLQFPGWWSKKNFFFFWGGGVQGICRTTPISADFSVQNALSGCLLSYSVSDVYQLINTLLHSTTNGLKLQRGIFNRLFRGASFLQVHHPTLSLPFKCSKQPVGANRTLC